MRAKKKLIVSLLVMAFVLLSIIATVAIAFALTQQTIKTSLNIGYTVEDIDGTASASFTIGGVTESLVAMKGTNVIGDKLVFKAGDTTDAGNLMFPEDALALTAQNDNVVIQYTYSNTGAKHYIASMDFNANIEADNMKVEYSIDGTTYSEDRYAVVVPANTANRSYWIKISIADKAKSASFTGDFDWLLSGCDPQDKAYLSLPKVEFQGSNGSYSASISSNSEYVGNMVFPKEVNGDPVTIIAPSSLTDEQKAQVKGVYIPDSVTTIQGYAFKNFANLETITFEQNEKAGASLQSTTGLTHIEPMAFSGCSSLREFIMPDTLTEIYGGIFNGCTALRVVKLGASFVSGVDLFPLNVITDISVSESSEKYYAQGNCVIEKDSQSLIAATNNCVIPEGVLTINRSVFSRRTGLKSINIPNSVVTIQSSAFANCTQLTEVNFGAGLTTIGDYAFENCTSLKEVKIPDLVTTLANYQFKGCSGVEKIIIGKGLASFRANWMVFDLTSVKTIVVDSENATYVSVNNCLIEKTTKTLVLGSANSVIPTDGSVTSIGAHAFYNCKGLTSVLISESITNIGFSFVGCDNLVYASFENKSGWKKKLGPPIYYEVTEEELSDPATAATLLKSCEELIRS